MAINYSEIQLSNKKFKEKIKICERNESWLDRPIFPSVDTLALIAELTYKDDLHDTIFSTKKTLNQLVLNSFEKDVKESLKKLKQEWHLLTTAGHKSDGYFGAAFWNSTEQQLVISHRGTNPKDISVLLADIEGIIKNRRTSQIDSACTFVAQLLHELSEFNHIQLTITGHSLGAWLAQVTTFSAEYLTLDRDINEFRVKSEKDVAYHVHCVGFESPGCRRMITKLSETYHHRYEHPDHNFWTNLDITLYLTRPNMVNTFCKHVGKLYQIDITPLEKSIYSAVNYLTHYHSRKNIVLAFTNGTVIKVIHDWPLVTFPEETKNDVFIQSKSSISVFKQFVGSLPGLIFNYVASGKQEVENYFRNNENNVVLENSVYGINLHYAIVNIDTRTCDSNVFSDVEKMFLMCSQYVNSINLKNQNDVIIKEINKSLPNLNLDRFRSILKCIICDNEGENKGKIIRCNAEFEVEKIVNFTKQLFRFFSNNSKRFVQNLIRNSETSNLILRSFSRSCVDLNFGDCMLEFCDTIGLEDFLKREEQKIFLIKTKFKFEMRRIYSILRTMNIKYPHIFLESMQLTHLNSCLHLSESFNSMSADHVLVLDYQAENLDQKELEKLENLLENIQLSKVVIVVQSEIVNNLIKKAFIGSVNYKVHDENLYCSDLKADSKQFLFKAINEKRVMLQGRKIQLLNFFQNEQLEALDSNIVAELMKEGNEVLEIGKEPLKLCQSEAAFMNRFKLIETENLVNAFKDENSQDIFVVSVSIESNNLNHFDSFIRLLKISDENDTEIIKRNTKIIVNDSNINYGECLKINIVKCDNEEDENIFKEICFFNPDRIAYRIGIMNERFYMLQVYNPSFYIKRHLFYQKQAIIINNIFHLLLKEKFVFSEANEAVIYELLEIDSNIKSGVWGLDKKSEQEKVEKTIKQNIFASFNESDAINMFKEWCLKFKHTPVHWIKIQNTELVWQQSHFSIKELRKKLEEKYRQEYDEEALANLNNKVVAVVAEPGMGKSTTLTRLSEYKLDDSWVIRLNLKDYQSEILRLPKAYDDADKSIEFVVNFLMRVSNIDLHKALTFKLLKYCLRYQTSQSLLVLFDGFDEINKESQFKLIALMKFMKAKTFANLWVTSREHCTNDLEVNLGVFATSFKRLDLNERQKFLKTFWQAYLKLDLNLIDYRNTFNRSENDSKMDKFDWFCEAILGKSDKFLDEKISKFMGIPLQLRLLAEGFLPELETYIKSPAETKAPHFDNLSLTQVYQRFINFKFKLYFQVKTNLSVGLNSGSRKWLSSEMIKVHQRLAMRLLFPNKIGDLIKVKSPFVNEKYEIDPHEELELKRVGITHSTQFGGEIEFIHQTFAEYFAAHFMLSRLRKHNNIRKSCAIQQLLIKVLKEYPIISYFLDEQITDVDLTCAKSSNFSKDLIDALQFSTPLNLTKFILSFFKNKVWLLSQCNFNALLMACIKEDKEEMMDHLLSITLNHYDVVHKMLYAQRCKFYLRPRKYVFDIVKYSDIDVEQLLNNFNYDRRHKYFKIILNGIKCYPKMPQEFLNKKSLPIWRKIVKGDRLGHLLKTIKKEVLTENTLDEDDILQSADIDVILRKMSELVERSEYEKLGTFFNSLNNVSSYFFYFEFRKSSLGKCLLTDALQKEQETFVYFLFEHFKNDPIVCVHFFFQLRAFHPKHTRKLIDSVRCAETKEVLSYLLNELGLANSDLTINEYLREFGRNLLKIVEDKHIISFENLLNSISHDSEATKFLALNEHLFRNKIDLQLDLKTINFEIFKRSLQQLAKYGHLVPVESNFPSEDEYLDLSQVLKAIKYFPKIYHYILLQVRHSYFWSIFDLSLKDFAQTHCYLSMLIINGETLFHRAIRTDFTKGIGTFFTVFRSYPTILTHLLSMSYEGEKSCLHFALMVYPATTIKEILSAMKKDIDLMKHVINNFVGSEEDKLDLYQVTEMRNAGALITFLNNIKTSNNIFSTFILPADVSVKPSFYLAGESGCKEVMDTLLSALKSEPDTLWQLLQWSDPQSGQTVLHRACDRGYREIVEALLHSIRKQPEKLKMLFFKEDQMGHTALDCAILSEDQYFMIQFKLALRRELVAKQDYKHFKSAFGGEDDVSSINSLVKYLPKLSSRFTKIPTMVNLLLIFAKSFNYVELMLAIFENKDLSLALESVGITLDVYGYRLFHGAIERDSLELVDKLIKKGVDVNATNGFGYTPLMRAIHTCKLTIADLLLDNGADVYAADMHGRTAISIAHTSSYEKLRNFEFARDIKS